MSQLDPGEIQCTLTVEALSKTGESTKKTTHQNISLYLGRNEFKELQLKVILKIPQTFSLKTARVFKKFARDGKASIEFDVPKKCRLLLANCPPDQLIMFLKTMQTKLACATLKPPVNERKKLLSVAPRAFDTISPLQMKELETLANMRAKAAESAAVKSGGSFTTPKLKRKRQPDNQENFPPKMAKILCPSLCPSPTADMKGRFASPASNLEKKKSVSMNRPVSAPVKLSKEQQRVLDSVTAGNSIFFTGSAGTGKSFLLKRIIGALPPQYTFATASTGVAACHIGGQTLHSFAGIGSGKNPLEQCIQLASRPQVAQNWRKCRYLIIDEISMVDGDFFDKLDLVAKVIRKNDDPFGGIQLILSGDFLQLPPVTKGKEKRKFAFQSRAWKRCINMNFELTAVRRQSDKNFVDILQNVRMGRCPANVTETLRATVKHNIERQGILATRLCTHKDDVDLINTSHLNKITDPAHMFKSTDSDPALTKTINAMSPVPERIELRLGAQVMLTKNLDVDSSLVNGARGVVVGFEADATGYPIVRFMSGRRCTIQSVRMTFKVGGGNYLTRRQLPLKLAWAISIHKSQGMTLDCVEMSLSKVFECGQAYVALSRASSLEGLRVLDFTSSCVRSDPAVLKFYRDMSMSSAYLTDDFYATQA